METGTVKFFDGRPEKRFGFIRTEGGVEIFFHFNDGRPIVAGKKAPEFSEEPVIKRGGKTYQLREPKRDDQLVFTRTQGYRGDKASPWGFKANYDEALKEIADRPIPPTYRVLKSSGKLGESGTPENPKDAQVLWEGNDLDAVMRRFPLPKGNQSPGSDPLIPYFSHEDGFEVRHWWELKKPDGTWEHCPDPRPLPGVLRQFEQITHRW